MEANKIFPIGHRPLVHPTFRCTANAADMLCSGEQLSERTQAVTVLGLTQQGKGAAAEPAKQARGARPCCSRRKHMRMPSPWPLEHQAQKPWTTDPSTPGAVHVPLHSFLRGCAPSYPAHLSPTSRQGGTHQLLVVPMLQIRLHEGHRSRISGAEIVSLGLSTKP